VLLICSSAFISDSSRAGPLPTTVYQGQYDPPTTRGVTKVDKRPNTKTLELYGLLAVPLSLLITVLIARMILG
jgi:hypothetical protein